MWAKVINDEIVWVEKKEPFPLYDVFLNFPCKNPWDATGGHTIKYYDFYRDQIIELWSKKQNKDFPSDFVFGIPKEEFIDYMDEYVSSGYTLFFRVLTFDLDYYIICQHKDLSSYGGLVEYILEFSQVLK
ncbi:hypothetical protein CN481_20160 [Bacillus sp. AFS006103]|nr:hypothetical protein CN481_20160 [Bacillus sp. AFS006103]